MPYYSENFKTLANALDTAYRLDQLKLSAKQIANILKDAGIKAPKTTALPTRKSDLIHFIEQSMLTHPDIILAQIDTTGTNAIAETVHHWDGMYQPDQFFAKYRTYPSTATETSGNSRWQHRSNTLHLLKLIFINGIIPADFLAQIKKIVRPPAADKITYITKPASSLTIRKTSYAAAMNLSTLLTMVDDNKIRVSKSTSRATAATIKAIEAALYEGDFYDDEKPGPIQAFAWPLLLQGGGFAEINGTLLKLTQKGRTALKKDLAQGLKTIWTRWEKTKIIDEYTRISMVKGQKAAKGRAMTSPVRRRPVINEALACLTVDKWVTVDEFVRYMRSINLNFDMTNYNWKLYIGDPHYGLIDHYDTWPILQLRYILVYLLEYCATLGIIDVAYQSPVNARAYSKDNWDLEEDTFLSMCDGLMAIRLTDLGAYALGLTDGYSPQGSRAFEADNTTIRFTGNDAPLPDSVLYLDQIGDQTDVGQWHLSMTSLVSAMKAGESLKNIQGFIKKITGDTLTAPLAKLFDDVNSLSTAVVDRGNATLLECQAQIRQQILTDKKLSTLCLPAGDRHIVVLPDKKELFVNRLESLGVVIG